MRKLLLCSLFLAVAISVQSAHALLGGRLLRERDPEGPSRSVVLLEMKKDHQLLTFCTGTLIAKRAILTAAHCFDKYSFPELNSFDVSFDIFEDGMGRRITVPGSHFVSHPSYTGVGPEVKLLNFDIAIAFFDSELPPGLAPAPIDTDRKASYSSKDVQVYGYGRSIDYRNNEDKDPYFSTGILRFAMLKVVDFDYSSYPNLYLTAYNEDTSSFICQGDSGGPQFVTTRNGFKVIGVNSGGGTKTPDGKAMATCVGPGSVAKVAPAAKWIEEQIKGY